MLLVVAKGEKMYYIKEFTGTGVSICKNKEGKFLLWLDDRDLPVATYKKWESANLSMQTIAEAYINGDKAVQISPND